MNAVEKALEQIEACSCIIACRNYEDVRKALKTALESGYEWENGVPIENVIEDLKNIDRSFFITVYREEKRLEDFFELAILKMNEQEKEMFLNKVILSKNINLKTAF